MKKILFFIILFMPASICIQAQLTVKQKHDIIDSVIVKLNSYYVFPEMARQMELQLRKQQAQKKYDTIQNEQIFADVLTADLRLTGKDKHLVVSYSAALLPVENNDPEEMPASQRSAYAQWLLSENYGIKKLEVLPGNIGYIDFKWFCGPEYAGNTYAAAMNYIAHTDALIIDLRNSNGAMSMYAIPFICSYFFEEPVHLNDFYWRGKNETIQTWTQNVVPGKKYLKKPIYILTSGKTFSGAEEFAYDLQNLKRATIIGQTTAGGANGGGSVRLSDHFEIFIPSGRAINPVTKTNWEGTGVSPDTMVKANQALYKARLIALQYIIDNTMDARDKLQLNELIIQLQQNPPAFKKVNFSLPGFENAKEVFVAGSFNNWASMADPMRKNGKGWITDVEAEPGEITYKFIVDGVWILDPLNKAIKKDGDNINSLKKPD